MEQLKGRTIKLWNTGGYKYKGQVLNVTSQFLTLHDEKEGKIILNTATIATMKVLNDEERNNTTNNQTED